MWLITRLIIQHSESLYGLPDDVILAIMSSPQLFAQYPGIEPIARYCNGGFHPIHINDVLHNRYRIVNKLGYGAYGTIWLVEDLNSGRCAALKVLAAEVSKNSEVKSEVAILRHLKQRQLNAGDGGSDGRIYQTRHTP